MPKHILDSAGGRRARGHNVCLLACEAYGRTKQDAAACETKRLCLSPVLLLLLPLLTSNLNVSRTAAKDAILKARASARDGAARSGQPLCASDPNTGFFGRTAGIVRYVLGESVRSLMLGAVVGKCRAARMTAVAAE